MHAPLSASRLIGTKTLFYWAIAASGVALCWVWPHHTYQAVLFAAFGMISVAPLVIPGIGLAAWIVASSADKQISKALEGKTGLSVLAGAAIGALTPVCGVTVLPLMAGLLAAGVPLAPIMAFWLSSPVTDPAMLTVTAATLGWPFAFGKTIAAFGLGLAGGAAVFIFANRDWVRSALRDNTMVKGLSQNSCAAPGSFNAYIWREPARRHAFARQSLATSRLLILCLFPAFMAEYALNAVLTPSSLAVYAGEDAWWAIPAAVFIGAPAYIDGFAALPLTRALIDNGMAYGAALAFLVSGGVVSIWGALAIFPVLKLKPFILYLAVAVTGSMLTGYIFEWIV